MSFRFLTAGESHGKALLGTLEGLPSGLAIDLDYIQAEMRRRKLGFGRGARQKIENDHVEIVSGVRHGKTLGSPIGLLIWNQDWKNWETIMQAEPYRGKVERIVRVPRPGHADFVGGIKYDHEDMRNVLERSSARETAARVAVGSIARKFLADCGVAIASRVVSVGPAEDTLPLDIAVSRLNAKVDDSPLRCLNPAAEKKMVAEVLACQKTGDTLGGTFEVYASGLPMGLGSYVQWDRRIDGKIGQAFLSLNAIKGVEIGLGFGAARRRGSQVHDELALETKKRKVKFVSNQSGGIDGGMTTGQILTVRAAMKPLSTLMKPLRSVDLKTMKPAAAHVERSDVCAVPAAAVIGESLLALVLAETMLEKFGGDSMKELVQRVDQWKKEATT